MMSGFLALLSLGLLLGALLAFASLQFAVAVDPLVQKLQEALPGYNCGACGLSGCSGYAEALADGNAALDLCRPGGQSVLQRIAGLLHKEVSANQVKKIACVSCHGGVRALNAYMYSGIASCQAAALVQNGYKKCRWGCLGFGDCAAACTFGALTMGEDNLPVISADKCVDCGACLKACPKKLIQQTPQRELKRVACSNHDFGKTARAVCAAACTACGLCVRNCPYQAVTLKDKLAVIDPDKCTNCGACAANCPSGVIL